MLAEPSTTDLVSGPDQNTSRPAPGDPAEVRAQARREVIRNLRAKQALARARRLSQLRSSALLREAPYRGDHGR